MSPPVVYVSNLPAEVTKNIIEDVFDAEDIEVESVEILKKGTSMRLKASGLATVTLKANADTKAISQKMDGKLLLGRPIIVREDRFVSDDPYYQPDAAA